jgi:hypothetical protein
MARADPPSGNSASAEPRPHSGTVESPGPAAGVKAGTFWPYTWLTVDLLIVTSLLALMTFNVAWQSISVTAQKAGESVGRSLILLILLLYGAKAAWKSLVGREPESNSHFKHKHREFQVVAGGSITVILIAALSYGVTVGRRIEKNKRVEVLLGQVGQLASKNADFRLRLGAIRSAETPTMRDFYRQCLALEGLMDEFEPHRQKNQLFSNSVLREVADEPKLVPTVQLLVQISEKDSRIIAAFRVEVAKAKELIRLPPSRQVAYYETEIAPIEAEIQKLANEQMGLLRDARERGITLPADISELLNKK